jgi:hypothetical protein
MEMPTLSICPKNQKKKIGTAIYNHLFCPFNIIPSPYRFLAFLKTRAIEFKCFKVIPLERY